MAPPAAPSLLSRLCSSRLCSSCSFEVKSFCCGCKLSLGVYFISIFALVNASLAFAGEAALYAGLATAIAEQAEGRYLPPGTKITDSSVQGGLIAVGLYMLVMCVAGFIAACRRAVWASTLLYVQVRRGCRGRRGHGVVRLACSSPHQRHSPPTPQPFPPSRLARSKCWICSWRLPSW